jgi:BirA family biotin operon repressor/biotin-[acetyl-CoA-carboxylase] ligase
VIESLPDDLAAALNAAASRLGGYGAVRYVVETGSTNDVALALAAEGAPEGTAVLADLQTQGRGRRGRVWFSPPGAGLYLSVVVRTQALLPALSLVTLAVGVAAADAIEVAAGLRIELKWPNDLVIGRPWRKLGGILCESSGVASDPDAIIIGLGVNLRSAAYPPDLAARATSLESELGRQIDRATVVVEYLAALNAAITALRGGGAAGVRARWRSLASVGLGGAAVHWRDGDALATGEARDIDDDGALVVDRDGRAERLVAGEVTWERLSRD